MGYGEQRYDASSMTCAPSTADGGTLRRRARKGRAVALPAGTTRVSYTVNLQQMERDITAASDSSRVRDGYLALGYSVFGYVDGFETRAARLHVEAPAGWPVLSDPGPAPAARSRRS